MSLKDETTLTRSLNATYAQAFSNTQTIAYNADGSVESAVSSQAVVPPSSDSARSAVG